MGLVSARKAVNIYERERKITGVWEKAQGKFLCLIVCTMLRYPKVASTTGSGSSGDVFVIRWLPLLLRHRVVLAARPRRDFRACSAFYVFRLSAQRPTPRYSGKTNMSMCACCSLSTQPRRNDDVHYKKVSMFLRFISISLGSVVVPGISYIRCSSRPVGTLCTKTSLSQVHSERVLIKRVLDIGGKSQ